MQVMDYQRHCILLGVAAVPIVFFGSWPVPAWIPRPVLMFGLMGALHALALVVSLNSAGAWLRRSAFVCIAAGLSVFAPIAGSALAGLVGDLGPSSFLLALVLASVVGASTYWLLIRWSWIAALRYKSLGFTTALCGLTTPIAFIGAAAVTDFGRQQEGALRMVADAVPTIAWWCAFSYSLYRGEIVGSANNALQATREDARA